MSERWKQVLRAVKDSIFDDRLVVVAPGVAYYLLLGLLPSISALVLIYSLIADPIQVQNHLAQLRLILPADAVELLNQQIAQIAAQRIAAGWGLTISVAVMLWAGSYAMAVIVAALNVTFGVKERRGFLKLTLLRLVLSVGAVTLGLVAIGVLVAVPLLLDALTIAEDTRSTLASIRWPLLLLLGMIGLSILYQWAPDRARPRFRWLTPGSVSAAIVWVLASGAFSLYVDRIDATQELLGDFLGAFSAVVVMMLWMLMSGFVMLMGAELDAALERYPPDKRRNVQSTG